MLVGLITFGSRIYFPRREQVVPFNLGHKICSNIQAYYSLVLILRVFGRLALVKLRNIAICLLFKDIYDSLAKSYIK